MHMRTHHHPPTYSMHIHTKKRRERKTTALSSKESSQINFCFFPVLPLMHLQHSLLTCSLPPLLSPLFPPVLALSRVKMFPLFSLCEWTRLITSLFNEHVVFLCSAHSPNTPSPTLAAFWEVDGLCVCVNMCVGRKGKGSREGDIGAI